MDTKKKPKPISAETAEKGKQFVAALLDEGQGYRSALDNFRVLVALEAMSRKENVPAHAARTLAMSSSRFGELLRLAGVKKAVILQERVSA